MKPEFDYYEFLEVDREADQKTIKRAFLKKARVLHPDVNKEPDAEEQFKRLNEAYSVLSDEQRRANYDRFGDPDGPGGYGGGMDDIFGGGFGMEDLFSTFFGGGMGGRARAPRTRGRDMVMNLRITLEQAAAGLTRTVTYDRLAPCDDCGGTGSEDGGAVETCPACHGSGMQTRVQRTILGAMQTQTVCEECGGTGQVVAHPCPTCDGQGRTPSHDRVEIEIPAGVYDGQELRIAGMGEAGVRGEAAGDLVIHVSVEESQDFVRHGDDLVCVLDVDALHALVGTTRVQAGILAGERVEVAVPAASEHGSHVVVPGYGMPRQQGGRGDLVCVVNVVMPHDLTQDEFAQVAAVVAAIDARKEAEAASNAAAGDAGAGGTASDGDAEKNREGAAGVRARAAADAGARGVSTDGAGTEGADGAAATAAGAAGKPKKKPRFTKRKKKK